MSDPQPHPGQDQAHRQGSIYGNQVHVAEQSRIIEPFVLDLGDSDADFWYKALADVLHSLGDGQSAFLILAALYNKEHELPLAQ